MFDARTGQHLGPATLADQASPEQIAELLRTRQQRRKQLSADLKAGGRSRRIRYAATTTASLRRRPMLRWVKRMKSVCGPLLYPTW